MKRRLRDGIQTTPASGDLVVYDAGDDSVHVLNPVGKLILEAHLDGRTVAEIEMMVKKAFALVPTGDIQKDIRRFVADLEKKGIVSKT
jgi:uncharacterized protein GlcG (DUF336 family)